MRPLRVYIDTSVFGGCFDREFAGESNKFIDTVLLGKIEPLISDSLLLEIADAPEKVQDVVQRLVDSGCERLPLSEEIEDLRDKYIEAGVVTPKYADDALHVAQATFARADVVVSWNFKHLVNPLRVREFNGVNTRYGFGSIIIMTPADVLKIVEEDNEKD